MHELLGPVFNMLKTFLEIIDRLKTILFYCQILYKVIKIGQTGFDDMSS